MAAPGRRISVELSAVLFTLVAPVAVAALVPWWIVRRWPHTVPGAQSVLLELGAWRHAGWPLIVAGAAGYLLCVRDFVVRGRGTPNPLDPPTQFVAEGLYRHVRNPMYVSIGVLLVGEALVLEAPALLAYVLLLWAAFHTFVAAYEEPHLQRVFGEPYARYRAAVPRWIPRLRAAESPRAAESRRTDNSAGASQSKR